MTNHLFTHLQHRFIYIVPLGCMVVQSLVHFNEKLTIDGKLSVSKIVSQHSLLKPIFDEGVDWFVWKAGAEIEFPDLPDIAQRALNAKFSGQQGQDCFQVFLRAVPCWSSGMACGRNDHALFIVKDIVKGSPTCTTTDVASIVEIARKFGGTAGAMVEPLRLFISTFKHPGRSVATSTLQAIAGLKLAPDELCPMLDIGICPNSKYNNWW